MEYSKSSKGSYSRTQHPRRAPLTYLNDGGGGGAEVHILYPSVFRATQKIPLVSAFFATQENPLVSAFCATQKSL